MSGWNETQAAHDRDKVRGFPFSPEAERRLAREAALEKKVELEQRFNACVGEFEEIAERLERLASACGSLAERYDEIAHQPLVPEGLRGAIPEIGDIAEQIRTVAKAVEIA